MLIWHEQSIIKMNMRKMLQYKIEGDGGKPIT